MLPFACESQNEAEFGFSKTWRSCGKFTEGAWWEHSASIRSQSIIDVHVNNLWGRAMEKMTLYSGTHTYCTHICTRKDPQRADIHASQKKSVIECIYLIFMHTLNGSFVWMLSCFRCLSAYTQQKRDGLYVLTWLQNVIFLLKWKIHQWQMLHGSALVIKK